MIVKGIPAELLDDSFYDAYYFHVLDKIKLKSAIIWLNNRFPEAKWGHAYDYNFMENVFYPTFDSTDDKVLFLLKYS